MARDVLQDTLVKAIHARAQGAGVDNLEGWLFRIAHNASLDFLRDRSWKTVIPLTEDIEAAPTYPKRTSSRSAFGRFCGCLSFSAVR